MSIYTEKLAKSLFFRAESVFKQATPIPSLFSCASPQ